MRVGEVSVIVPTYNRAARVARAVESVLAQTYPRCHAVVVVDGSTGGTAERLAACFGANPRVRQLSQPNRGAAAARNLALAELDAEYVAFLDPDDVWRPWKLEAQIACLELLRGEGVGLIWGDMDVVDDAGALRVADANRQMYGAYRLVRLHEAFSGSLALRRLRRAWSEEAPDLDSKVWWGDVYGWMARGNLCPTPSVVLTRERAAATGRFDESMQTGEDYDYFLRASALGPCAFLDAAVFSCREGHGDRLTSPAQEVAIAENALRALEGALAGEGPRPLHLTPATIRDRRAHLHAWIGGELLNRRDHRGARRHLASSLQHRPLQPRLWGLLAAASLPPGWTEGLRRTIVAPGRAARVTSRTSDRRPPVT
jgi:glycosyltransferase involved in cell wall biosynthesis